MEVINGGTLDIDSPRPYSAVSAGLLKSLGIEAAKLRKECDDPSIYAGLKSGVFFDKETFGAERLGTIDADEEGKAKPEEWKAFVAKAPLSEGVKKSVLKIQTGAENYYPGLSNAQKKDKLWRLSYKDYLLNIVKADPATIALYQHRTDDLWGCGIDAISALDCWGVGLPGFAGLNIKKGSTARMGYTPAGYSESGGSYSFHYPDGNASIARLLVRALIPGAISGHDARDIVTAKADYSKLDASGAPVRIRLN